MQRIEPRSGTAFLLNEGERLDVVAPEGGQVADLVAFNRDDPREAISNGRTFDYTDRIYLGAGDTLYSNRSNPMLAIVHDEVKRHDFLLTPCSKDTFERLYDDMEPLPGCFGNLASALRAHGIESDAIPCAFNCFMNVPVDGASGGFDVLPPTVKPGEGMRFEAKMDLIIGLTACSAPKSNGGSCKPIDYRVHPRAA